MNRLSGPIFSGLFVMVLLPPVPSASASRIGRMPNG